MWSLPVGPRTAATAKIPIVCSATSSFRWCSNPRRTMCRIFTWKASTPWASSPRQHDIRFVEDDWESPTLGAWGLGWEVWLNGMEVSQFTYFQQVGGIDLSPVSVELTYGLERLAMYLQGVESVYDLAWNKNVTYGHIYHQNEVEQSRHNFEASDAAMLLRHFSDFEGQCKAMLELGLPLPAYDYCLKCSHTFNLLDARGAISITERTGYIGRVRALAAGVARAYAAQREELGYPMLNKDAR